MIMLLMYIPVTDHYLLVDSSSGIPGDRVLLLSPPHSSGVPKELTFYYYMHLDPADTTATLSVYLYSLLKTLDQQLFTVSGNQGSNWKKATICLPAGKYNLAFVATIGMSFLSDIALDNVTYGNDCSTKNVSNTPG
jgi:MAM domain, meprin/A5/mu